MESFTSHLSPTFGSSKRRIEDKNKPKKTFFIGDGKPKEGRDSNDDDLTTSIPSCVAFRATSTILKTTERRERARCLESIRLMLVLEVPFMNPSVGKRTRIRKRSFDSERQKKGSVSVDPNVSRCEWKRRRDPNPTRRSTSFRSIRQEPSNDPW